MATVDVLGWDKKKVGSVELDAAIFDIPVKKEILQTVVRWQLACRRQGTHKTKTRGEVSGGGKKPFKQKGTGNARQGSTRSSLMVGGGANFGPTPRSYEQATPKEMMRGALRSALSDRVKAKRFLIIDEFKIATPKTKAFAEMMTKNFKLEKVLIVDDKNLNLELSGRNVPKIRVLRTEGLNVYDIVRHEWIFMTKKAIAAITARLS